MGKTKSNKSPAWDRSNEIEKGQKRVDELMNLRRSLRNRNQVKEEKKNVITEDGCDIVLENIIPQSVSLQNREAADKNTRKIKAINSAPSTKKVKDVKTASQRRTAKPQLAETANTVPSSSKKGVKEEDLKLTNDEQRELLKQFDINPIYGPCRGITRRQRFERAVKFQIKPLPEDIIPQILQIHKDDFKFQNCVWDQNELLKIYH